MSIAHLIAILRARWWVVIAVLAVTVAATIVVSLLTPKKYAASASVLVDFKPDPVSAALYAGMTPPAVMATQVDVIQSDRVSSRVVRLLKLADNPDVKRQWIEATGGQGSIEQWLGDTFQRDLEVKPSRESSLITITYRAADPRFAAGLANAFTQAYVETVLELRVDPAKQYSAFFEKRAQEAREALERAQGKLSSYQKENGLIATDERFDVENQRLNELSSQLTALTALASESRSRQAQGSSGSGNQMQEVINNGLIAGLTADVSRQEARLQELNARLGERHPQVVEAKANIESLRARVASETRRVTGGIELTARINKQRVAEVQAAYDAQRANVLKMKAVRDEASVLVRDAENAQRAFEAINQRLTQTSLESQATQSNVNILTQAVAPLSAASPRPAFNALIAVFVGTVLGVGLALLLEFADRRVRGSADLVESLGLPLLGVMPRPTAGRRGLFIAARERLGTRRLGHQAAAAAA